MARKILAAVEDNYDGSSPTHDRLKALVAEGDAVTAVRGAGRGRAPHKIDGVQVLTGAAAFAQRLRWRPDVVLLCPGCPEQMENAARTHWGSKVEQLDPDLKDLTVSELKKLAKEQGIEGAGGMKKADLLEALEDGVRDDS